MYTRIDLCALSGIDIDNFKSLWRRDQLPIAAGANVRARRVEGYSALDVITVAVGQAFISQAGYERGLQASGAMPIAAAASDWIHAAFAKPSGDDIWAGMLGARVGRFENGRVKAGWHVGGTLAEVTAEISRENSRSRSGVVRAFLINVSEVIREVQERARQARIFFPESLDQLTTA